MGPHRFSACHQPNARHVCRALPSLYFCNNFSSYRLLIQRGYRIAFLTGRSHLVADITATNLKRVGYEQYSVLITRSDAELNLTAAVFKTNRRAQLVQQGFNIVANFGDQWSDVTGDCSGFRVKLPNYIYLVQ